jgi:hypothetical protein
LPARHWNKVPEIVILRPSSCHILLPALTAISLTDMVQGRHRIALRPKPSACCGAAWQANAGYLRDRDEI